MFAVVRIRGNVDMRKDFEDTLQMLRLKDNNNCAIFSETADAKGMIEKVKDWVTYGEISKETLTKVLERRLRMKGNERIEEKKLKDVTGFDSYEKLADALIHAKVKLKDFKKIQQIFRLTPPSKGFKSVKDNYPKGDLGYRGKEINELLERMI